MSNKGICRQRLRKDRRIGAPAHPLLSFLPSLPPFLPGPLNPLPPLLSPHPHLPSPLSHLLRRIRTRPLLSSLTSQDANEGPTRRLGERSWRERRDPWRDRTRRNVFGEPRYVWERLAESFVGTGEEQSASLEEFESVEFASP